MPELDGAGPAEMMRPLGLDRGLGPPGHLGRGLAALGDLDEPGPGVARVGNPADVARALELVHEETRRLLSDLGPFGQVGDPGAVRVDAGEHPPLGGGDVAEAGRGQVLEHPVLHGPVGDEAEQGEVQLAWVVILGHPALALLT